MTAYVSARRTHNIYIIMSLPTGGLNVAAAHCFLRGLTPPFHGTIPLLHSNPQRGWHIHPTGRGGHILLCHPRLGVRMWWRRIVFIRGLTPPPDVTSPRPGASRRHGAVQGRPHSGMEIKINFAHSICTAIPLICTASCPAQGRPHSGMEIKINFALYMCTVIPLICTASCTAQGRPHSGMEIKINFAFPFRSFALPLHPESQYI